MDERFRQQLLIRGVENSFALRYTKVRLRSIRHNLAQKDGNAFLKRYMMKAQTGGDGYEMDGNINMALRMLELWIFIPFPIVPFGLIWGRKSATKLGL